MKGSKVRLALAGLLLAAAMTVPSLAQGAAPEQGKREIHVNDARELAAEPAETGAPKRTPRREEQQSSGPGLRAPQKSRYGMASEYLSVYVADSYGATDDYVVEAGMSHTLTVYVANASGQAVQGATISFDGVPIAQTNAAGQLTFTRAFGPLDYYEISASTGTAAGSTWVAAAEPGWGVIDVYTNDGAGTPFPLVTIRGFEVDALGWTEEAFDWWDAPGSGRFMVRTGAYKVVAHTLPDAPAFYNMSARVNIADRARTLLTLDGRSTEPLTVTMTHAGSPVVGAEVYLTGQNGEVDLPDPTGITGINGQAVIHVTPGDSYAVVAAGSNAIGFQRDIAVGPDGGTGTIALAADAPTLSITSGAPATGTHKDTAVWIEIDGMRQDIIVAEGAYAMLPGDYDLDGLLVIRDPAATTKEWDYWFQPVVNGNPQWEVPLKPGQTHSFHLGGAMSPLFPVPPKVKVGSWPDLSMLMAHDSAALYSISWWDGSVSGRLKPTLTLTDANSNVVLSATSWWLNWEAEWGAYTLSGNFASGVGPYFPAAAVTSGETPFEVVDKTLFVQIADDYGAANDRVLLADGASHTLTFQVTDGTAPVSGAIVAMDGVKAVTDAQGTASITFTTATANRTAYVYVDGPTESVEWSVAMLKPGYGVVDLSVLDRSGSRLSHSYDGLLYNDAVEDWAEPDYSPILPAGLYHVLAAGFDHSHVPFLLDPGDVTVPGLARLEVTVDPRLLGAQSYTVSVKNGSQPLANVLVLFQNERLGRVTTWDEVVTGADGTVTLYSNPAATDTFAAMAVSGTARVMGLFDGLNLGASPVLDFAGAPALKFEALDRSGTPLTTGTMEIESPAFEAEFYLYGTGTYLVAPGAYLIEGEMELVQGDYAYEYRFGPKNLWPEGDPRGAITFAAGDALRTFTMGGEVTLRLNGPDLLEVGYGEAYFLEYHNATAVMDRVRRRLNDSWDWYSTVYPEYEVRDGSGALVDEASETSVIYFSPEEPGTFTVTGRLSGAGPLFGTEAPEASKTVTVSALPEISLSRPWVKRQGDAPVTVTVRRNGLPVVGAPVTLPPNSLVGGVPTSEATTDEDGQVTFTVNVGWGGNKYIAVQIDGQWWYATLLVTDETDWGVIRVELTGGVTFAGTRTLGGDQVSVFRQLPDGSYDESHGPRGQDPGYILMKQGSYSVMANPEGFYLTQGDVVVSPNAETLVTFDLDTTETITYSARVNAGSTTLTNPHTVIAGFGSPSVSLLPSGAQGSVQVMPGSYGITFVFETEGETYVLMEPGVASGTTVDNTYNAADLARVLPGHLGTEDASPSEMELILSKGNAAALVSTSAVTPATFYFTPGTVTLEGYDLTIGEYPSGWNYTFQRHNPVQTLVGGDNPGVWRNLGGVLTPNVEVLSIGNVLPGEFLHADFTLTNEVGDRLVSVRPQNGIFPRTEYTLESTTGGTYSLGDGLIGPFQGYMGHDLAGGLYTLKATQGAGPYRPIDWVATSETQVQVGSRVIVKAYASPRSHSAPYVEPLGLIAVDPTITGASNVTSYDFGIQYDPQQLSPTGTLRCYTATDYVDCAAVGVTMDSLSGTDSVRVTWSGSGPRPGFYVEFKAQAGFSGYPYLAFTPDSEVKENGVAVSPADITFRIDVEGARVAQRVVTGLVDRPGPTTGRPLLVRVSDGQAYHQNAFIYGPYDAPSLQYSGFNPPIGSTAMMAMAMSPGYQMATVSLSSSEAVVTLPTISLKFGDMNADGKIDGADLTMYAKHKGLYTPFFNELGDTNHDTVIDLVDMAKVARNYSPTAAPVPTGQVRLILRALEGVARPTEVRVSLWTMGDVYTPARQALTTVAHLGETGDLTVDLTSVPAGAYNLEVLVPGLGKGQPVTVTSGALQTVNLTLGATEP